MIESKERRKIERNNLIDIHFSKTIFLFSSPTLVSSVKIRVNIYNRTVKSVPRADIQLILNSFGKSAPGEMQISHSDLGHTRPESWTTQTETQIYLETESCFTHCTKHEAASCSHNENFPHGFYPCEVVHHLMEKERGKYKFVNKFLNNLDLCNLKNYNYNNKYCNKLQCYLYYLLN